MMEFSHARKVAGMLAALAEPTRLQIAYHLASGPHHVSQLAELVGAPMVNMSHHLGVMRQAGLLDDEKQGRKVVYQYRPGIFTPGGDNGVLGILNIGPFKVQIRASADSAAGKGKKK
ncbi:MAG TPA: metalloregulator ArsR/SmtB family transcription factor [Gemmata sp.]|jgi:DNA-binding transcriptional ArsR family regulator|nr:metalloregulator ArsR/SmtB family transcription factor [Gemmata sp.]